MSRPAVRAYESSDIHPRKVLWTAAVLLAAIALTHLVAYVLIAWFHTSRAGTPFPSNAVSRLPAELRQFEFPSIEEFRQREQQALETYAWVDRAQGVARVPIERGIALYVETHGGKPLGRGSAQARCDIPTYTPGATGCDLVFLPSVLDEQRAGSVGAPEEKR